MNIGVVLSTYQWPRALELSLWGYAAQTHGDFRLYVADDGSGAETGVVIERVARESGLDVVRVWHADRGFRKSEILNRAIAAADDREYLIFSDGDTIPRRDLVEVHARHAEPGRFLAGGYVKLSRGVSEAIGVPEVREGRATSLNWLRGQGFRPGKKALRWSPPALGALLDRVTPTPARWHGNNASTWRRHLLEVNGFDMLMGYGGQDAALGDRLENLGVAPKRIRHRAVAVHLWHERPWRDPEGMRRNLDIRMRIRSSGEVRATRGIAELDDDGGAAFVVATAGSGDATAPADQAPRTSS